MRQIFLMTAALALVASQAAAAAWETYNNEALGYTVMFPGKPTDGSGIYKSDLIPGAVTHFATLKDGDSTFLALEIDTGQPEEGTALMGEFEYWLGQIGRIAVNNVARLNVGMQYGRFLTIDCSDDVVSEGVKQPARARELFKNAAGLACPNGARIVANLFFTQGRLYAIAGMQTGANAKVAIAPVRFVNSLGWIGANADHARAMLEKVHPEMVNAAQPPAPAAGNGR